ncbi:MAG: hypothetical protein ACKOKF_07130 [Bacteroidota bacterium]
MKSRLIISFLLIILSGFQSGEPELLNGLPFPTATYMTTDPLGNCYVVADNQLLKFSPSGKPLQNYAEVRNGELRQVDASNPMKVVLFYPDMARIVVLGTQFAPQSTIELRNLGIFQPTLVCNSINGGFWIYDLQDFQLKKIDLNLQLVFQSGNLLQLTGRKVVPNFITEYNQQVFLNDPEAGILMFDQFGGYYKTLPGQQMINFQGWKDKLICNDGKKLTTFDLKRFEGTEVALPGHGKIKAARLSDTQLYLLTNDSLNIYSF